MNIYQIKVTLNHSQPPVWRRIQIEGGISLSELHDILQIVMGWDDRHLHMFHANNEFYGVPNPDFPDDTRNEHNVRLDQLAGEGDTVIYEYDFGDGWEHELKIEKIMPVESNTQYPRCTAGERACPPEDCGGIPGYEHLLEVLRNPESPEYEELYEWIDDDFDPEAFDLEAVNAWLGDGQIRPVPPANNYTGEELARYDSAALLELMIGDEDLVPRNVIDECARRGNEIVELLSGLLQDDRNWSDGITLGKWWLLQHAIMILGLIPSERAGLLLVDFMRRMSQAEDFDLQDWFAGYWVALFQNKPDTVLSALHDLGEDRRLDWYIRIYAMEVVMANAQRHSESALEHTLDWAADLAADEMENWEMRLSIGGLLLDFPRARYRPLLDELVSRQSGLGMRFSANDVELTYMLDSDQPEWERFSNPWNFYDPEAIEQRRQRWGQEDLAYHERNMDEDDLDMDTDTDDWGSKDYVYRRETPKVGRNDPCPCGSGKKYKKCCLQ